MELKNQYIKLVICALEKHPGKVLKGFTIN